MVLVPISYVGLDDDDDDEMVPVINQNKSINYNVVSDAESDVKVNENLFNKDIDDENEATPKNTVNVKVVQIMKNMQAWYNKDANKIVKKVAQEKATKESLIFFIELATIAMVAIDTKLTEY